MARRFPSTGSSSPPALARRLARPGQTGEHVIRTLDDATSLADRLNGASSVLVVGAGFLGMEVASTCADRGLDVTVVDRDPPLRRLLGGWLCTLVAEAAAERGVKFVLAADGVTLLGRPAVSGGLRRPATLGRRRRLCGGRRAECRMACRQRPVDRLRARGRRPGRVALHIVAVGDVTVTPVPGGSHRRTPHWTSAVHQARTAAGVLLHGDSAAPCPHDPYYWTNSSAWTSRSAATSRSTRLRPCSPGTRRDGRRCYSGCRVGRSAAAASVNHWIPIAKLKKLGKPDVKPGGAADDRAERPAGSAAQRRVTRRTAPVEAVAADGLTIRCRAGHRPGDAPPAVPVA